MSEFKIRVAQPNILEEDAKAMYDAVITNHLGSGPIVEEFEEKMADFLETVVNFGLYHGYTEGI